MQSNKQHLTSTLLNFTEYCNNSNLFNPLKITKYWRNQSPTKCLNKKFCDDTFPPNEHSLLGLNNKGDFIDSQKGLENSKKIVVGEIEWKPISKIFKKFNLFDDIVQFDDIKQGNIGNCYFLSAIASLIRCPNLIYRLFRTTEANSIGYYEIVFFIDGEWQIVIIDDYFPIEKGSSNVFKFAKPNNAELWVILLEKAWAKVNGGYINTIAGLPTDAINCLTGYMSEILDTKDYTLEALWKKIIEADRNELITCASSINDKEIEKLGLVSNHAYSVILAREFYDNQGNVIRLLKLRNPWGYKEFTGEWSKSSNKWTNEMKQAFDFKEIDEKGIFYIQFEHFLQLFVSTYICHMMYQSYVKSHKVDEFSLPNVFNLYIETPTKMCISVIFPHWRFNRKLKDIDHPITVLLASVDKGVINNVDGDFKSRDNIELVREFNKGAYIIIIYYPYEFLKENADLDRYVIMIHSLNKFNFKYSGFDIGFKLMKRCIIEGVKECNHDLYKNETKTFHKIDNQFKNTGLGYRVVINKQPNKYYMWEHNGTNIENMILFPPFKAGEEFVSWVSPFGEGIILGMKLFQYKSYWFNLESSLTSFPIENDLPFNEEDIFIPFDFPKLIAIDLNDFDIIDYDYQTPTMSTSKRAKKFSHIDLNEMLYEELFEDYGKYMELLAFVDFEDDKNLKWGKKVFSDNGLYIGQFNEKIIHGKGVYIWNSGNYYVGTWKNQKEEGLGKNFDVNDKLVYEGELHNGERHGIGTLFYDKGKYVGSFEFGRLNGKGIYTWKNGDKWEGYFLNNNLHGIGIYYPFGKKPYDLEYNMGKIVKK